MMVCFFYTGFPNYDTLMVFCDYVRPCADPSITKEFACRKSEQNATTIFPLFHEVDKERERNRNIEAIDQIWMYLTRMGLGVLE